MNVVCRAAVVTAAAMFVPMMMMLIRSAEKKPNESSRKKLERFMIGILATELSLSALRCALLIS